MRLFGFAHLSIIAVVAVFGSLLARCARTGTQAARLIRLSLGVFLLANEIVWWTYRIHTQGLTTADLPLQLSDFTLWLTIIALFTLMPWVYEVAYYAGLASAAMAVLTPDLWAPWPSYPSVYFFLEHGGVVVALVALTCGGMIRPRRGSIWRALIILNLYAAAVGTFNAVFHTNYMYLCRKPANASVLDYFGPWPIYLLAGEAAAVFLFWLLWLPFRRAAQEG